VPAQDASALVVVGRLGAPHGVSGALRVTSFTHPADNLLAYRPWLISDDGTFRPVEVEEVRRLGRHLTVRLAGVGDREAAARLRGRNIVVPRSSLPDPASDHEYYWHDLIGLRVVDRRRGFLGTVCGLMDTPAHDVLVVDEGRTLIPFVAAFVEQVDLEAGEIRVVWIEA
jgi:16S rRNA processing protein RimM